MITEPNTVTISGSKTYVLNKIYYYLEKDYELKSLWESWKFPWFWKRIYHATMKKGRKKLEIKFIIGPVREQKIDALPTIKFKIGPVREI